MGFLNGEVKWVLMDYRLKASHVPASALVTCMSHAGYFFFFLAQIHIYTKILLFSHWHQYLGERTTKSFLNINSYIPYFEVPNHVNASSNTGFLNLCIIDVGGWIILMVGDCIAYYRMFNSIPDLCSVGFHNILPFVTTKNVFRQEILPHDPWRGGGVGSGGWANASWLRITVIWTFLCHLITFVYFQTISVYYQKRVPAGLLCRMSHLFKLTNLMLKYLHCFLIKKYNIHGCLGGSVG